MVMEHQVLIMRRSSHGVEEEKLDYDSSSQGDDSSSKEDVVKVGSKRAYHETEDLNSTLSEPNTQDLKWSKQIAIVSKKERSTINSDSKPSSSSQKDQDNWLESARAEMGEVREENQRLKMYLGQMMKDYQALQMQFNDIIKQEESKKSTSTIGNNNDDHHHQTVEEPDHLLSLSLGRFSSDQNSKKDGKTKASSSSHGKNDRHDDEIDNEGLSLGLDCKFEVSKSHGNFERSLQNSSPVGLDSSEEQPKEEAGETWPPNKVLKSSDLPSGEDEAVQQNPLKKARVCVRARCDTPTMNDGCQWRKYGQKIAKGNPCPRAYYRCTVAPNCPVRKQVQRCAEDMTILITTYEGTHNHSLPLSATAMASTTSAAASMLLSGSSSTSRTGNPSSTSIPADLHGLNFYFNNPNSKSFYLQNSSLTPSPAHPTITLDLTSSNPSSSSSLFNRTFSSSSYPPIPKFSSSSTLNFGSAESSSIPWNNGLCSYGNSANNKNQMLANLNLARSTMENSIFQSYIQKKSTPVTTSISTHQQPLPDIAAATKAITADPSFQSALAAALTTIIGTGNSSTGGSNGGGGDNLVQKLKWGDHFPVGSGYLSANTASSKGNINACATSYLNKNISTNSQPGSLMFLPSNSLPFASPRSSSSSPNDNRDHTS